METEICFENLGILVRADLFWAIPKIDRRLQKSGIHGCNPEGIWKQKEAIF